MMSCLAGSYGVLVDAEDDGHVLALGGGGDDDLLGAGVMCASGLVGVGEAAGRLDDDVDVSSSQGIAAGSFSAKTLTRVAVDLDAVFGGA